VLDDEERILVGTTYKQVGSFEAKKIGAPLVARNIARHLDTLFADKPRDWKPLVYCWRGGNRSGSMAHILAKIGWPVVQLDGGYKAFRATSAARWSNPPALQFRVVCGTTGSGKSRLLETLDAIGAQVLDLERLAAHRGSVLGTCPASRSPARRCSRPASGTSCAASIRRAGVRRIGEQEGRQPARAGRRDGAHARGALHRPDAVAPEPGAPADGGLRALLRRPGGPERQLDHLVQLHGRARIDAWHALANTGGCRSWSTSCWSSTTTRPTCARSTGIS
jgi:tRNA 2-selenouridine synthase